MEDTSKVGADQPIGVVTGVKKVGGSGGPHMDPGPRGCCAYACNTTAAVYSE